MLIDKLWIGSFGYHSTIDRTAAAQDKSKLATFQNDRGLGHRLGPK
jgi:hypothetical protein